MYRLEEKFVVVVSCDNFGCTNQLKRAICQFCIQIGNFRNFLERFSPKNDVICSPYKLIYI